MARPRITSAVLVLGTLLWLLGISPSADALERLPRDIHIYLDYSGSIVGKGKANKKLSEMLITLLDYKGGRTGWPFFDRGDRLTISRFGANLKAPMVFQYGDGGWRAELESYGAATESDSTTDVGAVVDQIAELQRNLTPERRIPVVLIASDFINDGSNDACRNSGGLLPGALARQESVAEKVRTLRPKVAFGETGYEIPFSVGLLYVFNRSPYTRSANHLNDCFGGLIDDGRIKRTFEQVFNVSAVEFEKEKGNINRFAEQMNRRVLESILIPLEVDGSPALEPAGGGDWAFKARLKNSGPIPLKLTGINLFSDRFSQTPQLGDLKPQRGGGEPINPGASEEVAVRLRAGDAASLLRGSGVFVGFADETTELLGKSPGGRQEVAIPEQNPLVIVGEPIWGEGRITDVLGADGKPQVERPLSIRVRNAGLRDNELRGATLYLDREAQVEIAPLSFDTEAVSLSPGESRDLVGVVVGSTIEERIRSGDVTENQLFLVILDDSERGRGTPRPVALVEQNGLAADRSVVEVGDNNSYMLQLRLSLQDRNKFPVRVTGVEVAGRPDSDNWHRPRLTVQPKDLFVTWGKSIDLSLPIDPRVKDDLFTQPTFSARISCVPCTEPLLLTVPRPASGKLAIEGGKGFTNLVEKELEDGRSEVYQRLELMVENRGDIDSEIKGVQVEYLEGGALQSLRLIPDESGRITVYGKKKRELVLKVPSEQWVQLYLSPYLDLRVIQSGGEVDEILGEAYRLEPPRPRSTLQAKGGPRWRADEKLGEVGVQVRFANPGRIPIRLNKALVFLADPEEKQERKEISLALEEASVFTGGEERDLFLRLPWARRGEPMLADAGLQLEFSDSSEKGGDVLALPPIGLTEAVVYGAEQLKEGQKPKLIEAEREITLTVRNETQFVQRVDGFAFYEQVGDRAPAVTYTGPLRGDSPFPIYLEPNGEQEVVLNFRDQEQKWRDLRKRAFAFARAFRADNFQADASGSEVNKVATAVLPFSFKIVNKMPFPGATGGVVVDVVYLLENKKEQPEKAVLQFLTRSRLDPKLVDVVIQQEVELAAREVHKGAQRIELMQADIDRFGGVKNLDIVIGVKDTHVSESTPLIDGHLEWQWWQFKHYLFGLLSLLLVGFVFYDYVRTAEHGVLNALISLTAIVSITPSLPASIVWIGGAGVVFGPYAIWASMFLIPFGVYVAMLRRGRRQFAGRLARKVAGDQTGRSVLELAREQRQWNRRVNLTVTIVIALAWLEIFRPGGYSILFGLFSNLGVW